MTTLLISIRSVYGTERIYPVNEAAHVLARIARTATLSTSNLNDAIRLGCTVQCLQDKGAAELLAQLVPAGAL
jgi:hypothetical protein